ncbi:hypothetical protein RB653_007062 [Dictyostelium firmibasis]|uniref:Uncharacterized protein n=1 Tax=Dictyostelium firmibasis TaxID=79012 RepID=A0AAN7TL72_9MYCE
MAIGTIYSNIKSCNDSCIEYLKQCYICIITIYGICIQEIAQYSSMTITISFLNENINNGDNYNTTSSEMSNDIQNNNRLFPYNNNISINNIENNNNNNNNNNNDHCIINIK